MDLYFSLSLLFQLILFEFTVDGVCRHFEVLDCLSFSSTGIWSDTFVVLSNLFMFSILSNDYIGIGKAVDSNDPIPPIQMPRGYGGVAILWKKELDSLITSLKIGNERIQCVETEGKGYGQIHLLYFLTYLCSVYCLCCFCHIIYNLLLRKHYHLGVCRWFLFL
jgi:hypothetical protein